MFDTPAWSKQYFLITISWCNGWIVSLLEKEKTGSAENTVLYSHLLTDSPPFFLTVSAMERTALLERHL